MCAHFVHSFQLVITWDVANRTPAEVLKSMIGPRVLGLPSLRGRGPRTPISDDGFLLSVSTVQAHWVHSYDCLYM